MTGPTREEFEEHMRTHIPFRTWCEFCVKGKSRSDAHRKDAGEKASLGEDSIPRIGINYTFPRQEEGKRSE